ncbi:MAG TPA: PilZ domain-containing protein [Geobacteraceae bacterium]|nr:PilZ domain-containing protein [Geobacteraceae bacterium]
MDDRRKHERFTETLEIKVTWPGTGTRIGKSMDFSDGGSFIMVTFDPQPPVNTEMQLQLNSLVGGSEAPVLRSRVVRTTEKGIAFEFIGDN